MLRCLISIATAAVAIASSALATPQQDLQRAYDLFDRHQWLQARDLARAFTAANGRNYSADLIIAGSECMLHPHRPTNAAPFRKILADYVLPGKQRSDVVAWINLCTSAAPRQEGGQAGVSVSGLGTGPNTRSAAPTTNAPPLRRPPAPVARPVAAPSVVSRPAAGIAPRPMIDPLLAESCREPFVWRLAFPGDHVCVASQVHRDAVDDNNHAAERRNPNGAYGPMTCISGYVWRGARDGDTVCVVPQRRDQAAADNAAAASRRFRP